MPRLFFYAIVVILLTLFVRDYKSVREQAICAHENIVAMGTHK